GSCHPDPIIPRRRRSRNRPDENEGAAGAVTALERAAAAPVFAVGNRPRSAATRPVENVAPLAVTPPDLLDRRVALVAGVAPLHQRVQEARAADREADEARHRRRDRQPLAHLLVVLAAPQDDAADLVPPAAASGRHHLLAVLAAVQALDLPHV